MRLKHITTRAIALAVAIGAIAAPAASARGPQSGWVVRPNPDQQATELARQAAAPSSHTSTWVVRPNPDQQVPTPAATIVRVTNPSGGFEWGDAAIGAAAAIGLSAIALAGALTITQRRTRRSARAAG